MPIACGLLVAFSTWIAARSALPYMERESASNLNLAFTGEQIVRHVPAGSILFTSGNGSLLNFIQWKGDYELYPIDAFNSRLLLGLLFKLADNGQASPLQAARENYLTDAIYKGKSSADLVSEQNRIMRIALRDPQRPRRVFFISDGSVGAFKSKFLAGGQFDAQDVCNWREPATVLIDPAAPALAMGGWGRNRPQQSWHIIEIVSKTPATTAPAAAPSTQAQQQ
jgi:hypothetical protein